MKHEADATEGQGAKEKPKVVVISGPLHALLKQKAKAEGRILQALVEEALWPVVRPAEAQLEVVR